MHPYLLNIGKFTLYTYGFFVALAFLLGFSLFLYEVRRRGFDLDTGVDIGFWVLLSAILGSRVVYVAVNIDYYINHPLRSLMIWEGGLVWYGAFFGGLIAAFIYLRSKKLDWWLWADMGIVPLALAQAVGRIGCLMAGCCYGKETTLPWGIVFIKSTIAPNGIALHPTQIYHMLFNFTIFLFLFFRRKRSAFKGELVLLYVILYGSTRSIVEIFRGDPRGFFFDGMISTSQLIGLITVAAAVPLYFYFRAKKAPEEKGKK
ncbi:MAG: prolipoprotein diacylglyceryl transferase [Deltaproteobacteria bacterium]|uniref:Phosphatidylglycerol--prolipoprotein diacylglyceryl transferase n=1 Tax=Candidatus Zymogenus saltonus TaxID=2844893 RepID=A0A9D8PP65_9DELT|nr:prolipoprotein diacylglyceryl transferase [Candidatus Zymogenus saltonus]